MKKENKKQIVISRLMGNPAKRRALNTAGCPIRSGMTYRDESGRSMVEMLGVLAIMGVLSVIGVSAFNSAMNSLKANTLLYEVNKCAHSCTAQMVLMAKERCSLAEYGDTLEGYSMEMLFFPSGYFGIKLLNIPEKICQQIHTKGFPIASEILPKTCAKTNQMIFIFNNELKGETIGMPQSCTPQTVTQECVYKNVGNTCSSDGFCTCKTGQTLTPTGCRPTQKLLKDAYCDAGVKTDPATGQELCCWAADRCCPYGQIWVNGTCEECDDQKVFREFNIYYCLVCPNRVSSSFWCQTDCTEPDQVVYGGQCHCPFERPIMLNNLRKCMTCAEGGQTLNGFNVPLGYTREQIARYCNYRGGTGGYSYPCENGKVGLWSNETYIQEGEVIQAGDYGFCALCESVKVSQLNSRARCESCGGRWNSDAPNTQNEWDSGECTCSGTWKGGLCS
ncbi:MAG: Tfp pilus assembly protein FimT/FimU [Alphaproteobacteria bacterium]